MNLSKYFQLMFALSIICLRRFAYAYGCISTQLQDFRQTSSSKGACIEITDCSGGSIMEEIKVCLDECPSNTVTEANPIWPYNKCFCQSGQISSDFRICSETCLNGEVEQEDSKLCLTSFIDCTQILTQDRTMCGSNVCLPNQVIESVNGQKVCTCSNDKSFYDLETQECKEACPVEEMSNLQYKICMSTQRQYTGVENILPFRKRFSLACNPGEYSVKISEYYSECRSMSLCQLVDKRVSPEQCLATLIDCHPGYISADRLSCLNICPYGKYVTIHIPDPQQSQYRICDDPIQEIVLISIGFAIISTLFSFLLCQGMLAGKITRQEYKYVKPQFRTINEDEEENEN